MRNGSLKKYFVSNEGEKLIKKVYEKPIFFIQKDFAQNFNKKLKNFILLRK